MRAAFCEPARRDQRVVNDPDDSTGNEQYADPGSDAKSTSYVVRAARAGCEAPYTVASARGDAIGLGNGTGGAPSAATGTLAPVAGTSDALKLAGDCAVANTRYPAADETLVAPGTG